MASREPDNNCINCRHRYENLSFPHCVACLKNTKVIQQMPGWEPEEGKQ